MSAAICAVSCNLEFQPTDSGSGEDLLKSATTAVTIVDGIYRTMWTAGWSTGGNAHQCFGISAYNIALESMADDFIMQSQGNGWFWYDHCYNVKSSTLRTVSVRMTCGTPTTLGSPTPTM